MGIVDTLTEEHAQTSLRARLRTVQRVETNETTVGREEEIGIRTSQARKGIERNTINGHEDGGGKARLGEELNPVDIVVIGHDPLNYSALSTHPLPLYSRGGYGRSAINQSTNEGARKTKGRTEDPRTPTERSRDAVDTSPTR
jgi:hypothetical protein